MTKSLKTYQTESLLTYIAFAGVVLMVLGFLINRVVSNVGFLLVGFYTLAKLRTVLWPFKDKWMITFILLAFLPLISDLVWNHFSLSGSRGPMKLLLILFPVFIFSFFNTKVKIVAFHLLMLFMLTISSFYSVLYYINNYMILEAMYKISKVIPTLSFGDHIRISWLTVITCIIALYQYEHTTTSLKKSFYLLYILFQVVFLHVLGSKTGLVSLYISTFVFIWYKLSPKKKWYSMVLIPVFVLMLYTAYKTIPSLQQRFNYIKYDYSHYISGEYKEGLSDAIRFFSLKAGLDIITQHPIQGVGFKNLQNKMNEWYKVNVPDMQKKNYFLPSSQIIIYWASGGLLGLILFLSHLLIPFFISYLRNNIWFMTFFIPAGVSFLFETHLEGQLPLFVYGFFAAWFWNVAYRDNVSKDHSRLNIQ